MNTTARLILLALALGLIVQAALTGLNSPQTHVALAVAVLTVVLMPLMRDKIQTIDLRVRS